MRFLHAVVLLAVASLPALAVTVDFTTIANGTASSFSLGGVTITGSGDVVSAEYSGFRGLGIAGGGGSVNSLDFGETMAINYNQLVSNVLLTVVDVAPVGNSTLNFTAFNGATNLGFFTFPLASVAPQTYDVSALAGGQSLTRIVLGVGANSAPLAFQIQGTAFTPSAVPEPSSLLLFSSLLGGFALRRRFARS